MNQITLIGRLGRNPEIKYIQTGTAVLTFSMATNHRIKKDGEWKNYPDWHRIVAWDKLAEWNQHLKKGDKIFVVGRQTNRSWEDKDGNKKQIAEVIAKELYKILEPKKQGSSYRTNADEEDVPF